eukprot:g4806.t1
MNTKPETSSRKPRLFTAQPHAVPPNGLGEKITERAFSDQLMFAAGPPRPSAAPGLISCKLRPRSVAAGFLGTSRSAVANEHPTPSAKVDLQTKFNRAFNIGAAPELQLKKAKNPRATTQHEKEQRLKNCKGSNSDSGGSGASPATPPRRSRAGAGAQQLACKETRVRNALEAPKSKKVPAGVEDIDGENKEPDEDKNDREPGEDVDGEPMSEEIDGVAMQRANEYKAEEAERGKTPKIALLNRLSHGDFRARCQDALLGKRAKTGAVAPARGILPGGAGAINAGSSDIAKAPPTSDPVSAASASQMQEKQRNQEERERKLREMVNRLRKAKRNTCSSGFSAPSAAPAAGLPLQ